MIVGNPFKILCINKDFRVINNSTSNSAFKTSFDAQYKYPNLKEKYKLSSNQQASITKYYKD